MTGRLLIWPAISPRGPAPPREAYYLSWPGWERFRMERLGQSPTYEGLRPLTVPEPEGFYRSLSALLESPFAGSVTSLTRPFPESGAVGARLDILAGLGARSPSPGTPPHLLLALWSAAEAAGLEADDHLGRAMARKATMMAALRGEAEEAEEEVEEGGEAEEVRVAKAKEAGEAKAGESEAKEKAKQAKQAKEAEEMDEAEELGAIFPIPAAPSSPAPLPAAYARRLAAAWLEIAEPLLRPGDLLWPSAPDFHEALGPAILARVPGLWGG